MVWQFQGFQNSAAARDQSRSPLTITDVVKIFHFRQAQAKFYQIIIVSVENEAEIPFLLGRSLVG